MAYKWLTSWDGGEDPGKGRRHDLSALGRGPKQVVVKTDDTLTEDEARAVLADDRLAAVGLITADHLSVGWLP